MTKTIPEALSELLASLGFDAMARDVLTDDRKRWNIYARVILKNASAEKRRELHSRFAALNLI